MDKQYIQQQLRQVNRHNDLNMTQTAIGLLTNLIRDIVEHLTCPMCNKLLDTIPTCVYCEKRNE
jgi:hypothetical protein